MSHNTSSRVSVSISFLLPYCSIGSINLRAINRIGICPRPTQSMSIYTHPQTDRNRHKQTHKQTKTKPSHFHNEFPPITSSLLSHVRTRSTFSNTLNNSGLMCQWLIIRIESQPSSAQKQEVGDCFKLSFQTRRLKTSMNCSDGTWSIDHRGNSECDYIGDDESIQ